MTKDELLYKLSELYINSIFNSSNEILDNIKEELEKTED